MAIHYKCPCGKSLEAEEEFVGERIRCPICGQKLIIPQRSDMVAQCVPTDVKVSDRPSELSRPPAVQRSRRAVVAFVLALLSPLLLGIGGIVALVLGWKALIDIRRADNGLSGTRLAKAALVLGGIGIPVGFFVAVMALVVVSHRLTEARVRLETHHKIGVVTLALAIYNDSHDGYPPLAHSTKEGKPGLSWRVELLPLLGEEKLYREFNLDEPWDSPTNIALLPRIPRIFVHTSSRATTQPGFTHFRLFTGPNTAYPDWQSRPRIQDFVDGLSTTFLIVESSEAVPWTKPDELVYDPKGPLPALGGLCGRGFVAAAADGTRYWMKAGDDEAVIRALITINGHESIPREIRERQP